MRNLYTSLGVAALACIAIAAGDAQAQQQGPGPSSTRATVVELPPAAEDQGIVRLSTAATAEDVIQPVLEIERGKTVLLKPAYDVKRIAVGDPDIVDFVVNGANEIQLIAKAVGNTNVLIWDSGNRLQASIDIHVGAVRAQLVRELRRVLGRNDVAVDMAGESVVLRGQVPDIQTSEAAEAVARAFFVGGNNGSAQAAQGQNGAPARDPRVINLLSVGGNHQVMIEVVIAEMSRSVRRAFGTNLQALFIQGDDVVQITSMVRNLTSPSTAVTGMQQVATLTNDIKLVGSLINNDSFQLNVFLEAIDATQLGKVLAEPTLVARSGELASFLAGGEIPIPVADDDDVTIIFKRFGVQLEFLPTVLSEDRIHMQITPEVSQPDFTMGVSVAGTTVPAFRTRRAATGVELGDGQSFAIGGLLQNNVSTDYEQLPFIGDVPILGQLFRSQRFQRDETELVIIVTPRLVQPLGPEPVLLPTDRYVEPGKLSFYLRGLIEGKQKPLDPSGEKKDDRASQKPPSPGEEPQPSGLIGEFGHRLPLPRQQGES